MTTFNDNQNNQKPYAIGSMTGQVVYTSNGKNVVTINVYDQQGQVVRSVHKGLYGYTEEVSTTYNEMTGAVESTESKVNVRYGSDFLAKKVYTYSYGKKKKKKQSVCHGMTALSRETEYGYDFAGRLNAKNRQLVGSNKSYCSYSYDVHGWLRSISSGGFQENLYYADGLDGGCYNGNISTMKWKMKDESEYKGYNLKYDGNDRLCSATYGSGNNLTGNRNYFSESVEYDANGNITHLQRNGLTDHLHGGFGMVDDLHMSYLGNRLMSMHDDASHLSYAAATDFGGNPRQVYKLTYNTGTGSLVSDEGRNIANIEYDNLGNPIRIQFTNGNVTKYVYSAAGEKLKVIYQTAVPNISVAIGSKRELTASQVQYTDSIDYLLGGSLTLRNGRIDQYQFEEGYCQAEVYSSTIDKFAFCYYDQDHLGNIRQVTKADGSTKGKVIQKVSYYPFGLQLCDGTTDSNVQSHRYNGKELDKMHGLNTYDYGARQYNPVTARWDRMDPLAEKYYSISPYAYCAGNPVRYVDPDGREIFYNMAGTYVRYMNGDFYNGNEKVILDENDKFGQSLLEALNGLSQTSTGKEIIDALSNENVLVHRGLENGESGIDESAGGHKFSSVVAWNPNAESVYSGNSVTSLGHELSHTFDRFNNITFKKGDKLESYDKINGKVPRYEVFAVHMENKMRKELGLPLREYYYAVGEGCIDDRHRLVSTDGRATLVNTNGIILEDTHKNRNEKTEDRYVY